MLERKEHRGPSLPVLDIDYLERLARHLGGPAFAEILADGLIELADRTARLEALSEVGDLHAIARFAHDLIGVAGNLGLSRLTTAAAELQRAARDGDGERSAVLIEALRGAAREADKALRAYLAAVTVR